MIKNDSTTAIDCGFFYIGIKLDSGFSNHHHIHITDYGIGKGKNPGNRRKSGAYSV